MSTPAQLIIDYNQLFIFGADTKVLKVSKLMDGLLETASASQSHALCDDCRSDCDAGVWYDNGSESAPKMGKDRERWEKMGKDGLQKDGQMERGARQNYTF